MKILISTSNSAVVDAITKAVKDCRMKLHGLTQQRDHVFVAFNCSEKRAPVDKDGRSSLMSKLSDNTPEGWEFIGLVKVDSTIMDLDDANYVVLKITFERNGHENYTKY